MNQQAIVYSLKKIRDEFERGANRFPCLRHELFLSTGSLENQSTRDVMKAFRKANQIRLSAEWEYWHCADENEFGRFTGNRDGIDEFKRLAESVTIALNHADLQRQFDSIDDWLYLIYEMAYGYPTPLLRCELERWYTDDIVAPEADEEYDILVDSESDTQVRYPAFPLHWKLVHDVFIASVAAIDIMLDERNALFVGKPDWSWGLPVSFLHSEQLNFPAKEQESHKRDNPIRRFELLGQTWFIEFADEEGKESCNAFDSIGFHVLHFLIQNPWKQFSPLELLKGTKQGIKTEYSSDQDDVILDDEGIANLKASIRRTKEQIETTASAEELAKLKVELDNLLKWKDKSLNIHGKSKPIGSVYLRHYRRIHTQLSRAKSSLKSMPRLLRYLSFYIESGDSVFEFRDPKTKNPNT